MVRGGAGSKLSDRSHPGNTDVKIDGGGEKERS